MATEVNFYHLTRSSLEEALPRLLVKTLQAGERAVVSPRDGIAPLDPCGEMRKLRQAERGLHLGHAVVEAEHVLFVVPGALVRLFEPRGVARDAVATQIGHPPGKRGIVGQRHAAFRLLGMIEPVALLRHAVLGIGRLVAGRHDAVLERQVL